MVGVAYHYHSSTMLCFVTCSRKAFLICPGKILVIVTDETIIVVGGCVRWIAVKQVAVPRLAQYCLKVGCHNLRMLENIRGSYEKLIAP